MKKICSFCKVCKDISEFHRRRRGSSSLRSDCKLCCNKKKKVYNNSEIGRKKILAYKIANADRLKASRQRYYKKNKVDMSRKTRIYLNVTDNGLPSKYGAIRRRCMFPSQQNYKYYGGRGIKCLWLKYSDFKRDMYKSYIKHLSKYGRRDTTIDRIDPDYHYCKENCKWSTVTEQLQKRRGKISFDFIE